MSSSKLKMTSKTTQNTAKWIAMSLLTTIKYKAVRSQTCTNYYTTADTISYNTKHITILRSWSDTYHDTYN